MGLNLAGFMAAFICGPLIGGVVTTSTAAWMGVGGTLTATAFLWLFVPESLSQAARDKVSYHLTHLHPPCAVHIHLRECLLAILNLYSCRVITPDIAYQSFGRSLWCLPAVFVSCTFWPGYMNCGLCGGLSDRHPLVQATHKQKAESRWEQAPWNSLKILLRTKLYTQLAVIVCIAGFVAQGFMELLAQYLQLKLKYGKIDLVRGSSLP